jgi:hypothetical protein
MLNNIHELPSHLDQETLPEWINDGLLKGGIYALKTQSSATASLAISQALAENFPREIHCLVVTALPCNEILYQLHRSNSGLLSNAVENGSLKIFSPVGDYRKNIFRFGPERLLSELEQFCACQNSLIIFDHADSLFTVEDSEIVAAQADAYRKWMRKTQNIALFLFQDSIELSPGSPYFRSLASHFSGIAGLYMFRNSLEVGVDFWTTLNGTLLSQPLAVTSRADGSIDIRPSLAVNRRSRSRLAYVHTHENADVKAGASYVASTKTPTQNQADGMRMAEAKDVVSCLRATAFQTFQRQQDKAAASVKDDNVLVPTSSINESVSASTSVPTKDNNPGATSSWIKDNDPASTSVPVKDDHSASTSPSMHDHNPSSKRMRKNIFQRVAMTAVAFVALGILGVGMKHSWDYAAMDIFKSYSHLIAKLHVAQNAVSKKAAVAHTTDASDDPSGVESKKILPEEVTPSSLPAPNKTTQGISATDENPGLEVKEAMESPTVARLPQVEPSQQQLNQGRVLPNESVRVVTSKNCPEQLQAMKLCSNDAP